MTGTVRLVGAGPGDPGLITVRGLDRLRQADVVAYDRLVSTDLVAEASPWAELIFVGKERGRHCMPQPEIVSLLIDRARRGLDVVRLKRGDPFVFGRGGEEALALLAAGIPVEIVPGVSSALAVPAAAGIPLTHWGLASSFAVVTGHDDGTRGTRRPAAALASSADTLVLLMAVQNLRVLAAAAVAQGRPASTPAAVIRWGTTPHFCVGGAVGRYQATARPIGYRCPALEVPAAIERLLRWYLATRLPGENFRQFAAGQADSSLREVLAGGEVEVAARDPFPGRLPHGLE